MRRIVVIAWLVVIVAAIPFAARQTEHLSSGGFGVPGSGSKLVDGQLPNFPGVSRDQLAFALQVRDADGLQPALARIRRLAAQQPRAQIVPGADRRAIAVVRRAEVRGIDRAHPPVVIVPLRLTGTREQSANLAVDLSKAVEPGTVRGGVATYLVGQEALWAGMQDVSKQQLASAEHVGFPIVFIILVA